MLKDIDRVLRDFLIETQESLELLDQQFVDLEHDPTNSELLSSVFRAIHTIKGSAGFLRLPHLEQIAHHTEDVLAKLRNQSLTLNTDMATGLLHAVDGIKSILVYLERTGEEGEHNIQGVMEELKAIAEPTPSAGKPTPSAGDRPSVEGESTAPLKGKVVAALPPQKEDETESNDQQMADLPENASLSVEDTRIHVDIGLLDQLMNMTGELVLSRNRVMQLLGSETIDLPTFQAVGQHLNTVVSELQETMLKTRMQPVNKVFGMLPRLVRDAANTHGKQVELQLKGQETELDRSLLEALKDPLTHLVRNAIDHGLEMPDVRRQQGKPPTGDITIRAAHEGGMVHLDIADDGAGIDCEAVKAKAVESGILTRQQVDEMSERDLLQVIFRPGFSTSDTVTNTSGRGVGMDVVKRNLSRIGGIIDVETEPGIGTTVKLRIPITLAIIPVLIVKAADQRFAIPQVHLQEMIMPENGDDGALGIEQLYGAEVYRLRGELLPLLRLSRVLGLRTQAESNSAMTSIIVVSAGTARFGIVVDDVADTEEIVVKPLSNHVRQLACYDGATIMGDGEVALILNVSGLFTAAQFDLADLKHAEQEAFEPDNQTLIGAQGEHRQTIVLFRAGKEEYYGVPLAFVTRLEEFPAAQIERSGGREVLQYRGDVLPLMRLEDHLNIERVPDPDLLSLIVFSVEKQIGLMVREIVNTVEISTQLDTDTFQQHGVLGSTIVDGHAVLIVDIHGLIETAYPSWYKQFSLSKLTEEERTRTRVLLVEDSPFFLKIEQSYLESAGYQVLTAEHGNAALDVLKRHPIDVVVTDIDMPYCNGYELTGAIKSTAEWQHIPVMAVTALSGDEDRQTGIECGIDEYRVKLDRDDVLRTLELLIARSRKQET